MPFLWIRYIFRSKISGKLFYSHFVHSKINNRSTYNSSVFHVQILIHHYFLGISNALENGWFSFLKMDDKEKRHEFLLDILFYFVTSWRRVVVELILDNILQVTNNFTSILSYIVSVCTDTNNYFFMKIVIIENFI